MRAKRGRGVGGRRTVQLRKREREGGGQEKASFVGCNEPSLHCKALKLYNWPVY